MVAPRAAETKLINNIMVKQVAMPKRLQIGKATPYFQETSKKYDGTYYDKKCKAVPKRLASTQWGSWDNLKAAVDEGQAKEVIGDDGGQYFSWKEINVGEKGEARVEKATFGPKAALTDELHKQISLATEKVQWGFEFSAKEEKAISRVGEYRLWGRWKVLNMCSRIQTYRTS